MKDVLQASELATFDLHCVSHPVNEERCADSGDCSIRPVWMLLQQRIDEVLAGVLLSDLLDTEASVRDRVGLVTMTARSSTRSARAASFSGLTHIMSIISEWKLARDRRKRATVYLTAITPQVVHADSDWLSAMAPGAGDALVIRELQFARRALGLIVAERDALDDRTASDVAHQLASVINLEARRDADAGRAWSERWRAYTNALASRGSSEAPAARLARVMLSATGVNAPTTEQLVRATQYVLSVRAAANEALRTAFGAASLPEDVRPSAVKPALR